jgi:hypothetical protein
MNIRKMEGDEEEQNRLTLVEHLWTSNYHREALKDTIPPLRVCQEDKRNEMEASKLVCQNKSVKTLFFLIRHTTCVS